MTADHQAIRPRRKRELAGGPALRRPERDAGLARVRRGVYAESSAFADASREARYLLRIRAVHAVRPRAIVARESALALHGIPYGLEPDAVYTVGGSKTAGRKAGVVHAQIPIDARDVTMVGDVRATTVAYALADVARRGDAVDSVSAIDWALRSARTTKPAIRDALARQSKRGRARAEWAIGFADGRAESVGESWSRVRVFELGFAAPELQVLVTGPTGRGWRVDMRFDRPGRRPVYGEFDGMQKYGVLAQQQGKRGVEALADEKLRDDDLLLTGDPAHWVWDDVLHPARLEQILARYGVPRPRPRLIRMSRGA